MTSEPSRLRELFAAALAFESPAERQQYLAAACGEDEALRAEVAALLQAHDDAGSFLRHDADQDETQEISVRDDLLGTSIGPYTLRTKLGEGGFGVVYCAAQTEPVSREVALKVIKPGMDSREVIARFEAERQALALMDHPHIARVLDAGTIGPSGGSQTSRALLGGSGQGRPYFVMELVDGIPITQYCDRNRLDLHERLRLFRDVCGAVQHAHQKGIIHRDLKPSNILVAESDGRPVVKVIDFGVAKALYQQLTDRTFFTRIAQLIGTPLYMSPEQVESVDDIDTRADVYSLGVLLYELLTGTTPFNREQLRHAGLHEMRRIILEEEPIKPSTRISSLGHSLPSVAAVRRQEPRRLSAFIRGDLDWVVMKALDKDRERRYATASEFADDIANYLAHEPVLAGPPTRVYRLRKFVKRHQTSLLVATVVFLSLISGISVAIRQATRAQRARDRAIAAERLAERRLTAVQAGEKKTRAALDALQERDRYSRQLLYAADLRLAGQAWKSGDVRSLVDLLKRQKPAPNETDLRGFEWWLLQSFGVVRHRVLQSTDDGVSLARFLPRSGMLVTGYYSGSLRLFDHRTRQQTALLAGHESFANGVDVSPDGSRLASIGDDGVIRVWDLGTNEEITSLPADAGHGHRVFFVLEGQALLSSGEEPEVELWDRATGEPIHRFEGFSTTPHHGIKQRLAVSPDRTRCVAADGTQTARVYDLATREIVCELDLSQGGYVRCLAFAPSGRRIVGGQRDQRITIWDADTGQIVRQFSGHLDDVQDVACHPHGHVVASADKSGVVRVWPLGDVPAASDAGAVGPSTAPEWPNLFVAHDDRIWSLDFSPDGNVLATASRDGSVRLWPARHHRRHTIPAAPLEPQTCWLGATEVVVTGDRQLVFWNLRTGQQKNGPRVAAGIQSLLALPDHARLLTGHIDGRLRLWDARSRTVTREWPAHQSTVHDLAVDRAGRHLASCGEDGQVILWETDSGRMTKQWEFDERCKAVALSPDGKCLAVGCQNDVFVLDLTETEHFEGAAPFRLAGHQNSVDCLSFSPDGQLLASGSDDRTVRIWELPEGRPRYVVHGHRNKIESLAFTPDGATLASGDKDGRLALTHVATGRYLYDVDLLRYWQDEDEGSQNHWVSDLRFSPDGSRLACGLFKLGFLILDGRPTLDLPKEP